MDFILLNLNQLHPPTDNGGDTSPLSSFYFTVLKNKCYLMVPRGSKKDYLIAMTGLDSNYPTPDELAHIIEYDPE